MLLGWHNTIARGRGADWWLLRGTILSFGGAKSSTHVHLSCLSGGWPTFGVRQALTLRTRGHLPSCPSYPRLSYVSESCGCRHYGAPVGPGAGPSPSSEGGSVWASAPPLKGRWLIIYAMRAADGVILCNRNSIASQQIGSVGLMTRFLIDDNLSCSTYS